MKNFCMCAGIAVLAACMFLGSDALAQAGWREKGPMEKGRSHLAAAVIDGEIYVAGGTGVLGPLDIFELYDPIADYWIPLPALPGGREQFGMAAAAGKVFVSGGYIKDKSGSPNAELWIYRPEEGQWREGPDMPAARAGHVLVAMGGKLYVFGGIGKQATAVYAFDVSTNTWSTASFAMTASRTALSAAVQGSTVYLIGGSVSQGGVSARVDAFDFSSGRWRRLADLPAPRTGSASAILNGRIHVAGGATLQPSRTYLDHYVYNPTTNKWSSAAPLLTPRFASASATINGEWYVIGGGVGAGFFAPFTAADAAESFVL